MGQCPQIAEVLGPKSVEKKVSDQKLRFTRTWQVPFYLHRESQETGYVQEQRAIEEDALAWEMIEQEKFLMEHYSTNRRRRTTATPPSVARPRALSDEYESKFEARKKMSHAPVRQDSQALSLLGIA
jgi:hypothetical protein